jgi:hypothetical protein
MYICKVGRTAGSSGRIEDSFKDNAGRTVHTLIEVVKEEEYKVIEFSLSASRKVVEPGNVLSDTKTLITNKCTKRVLSSIVTHVPTLLGHLQGELFRYPYTRVALLQLSENVLL